MLSFSCTKEQSLERPLIEQPSPNNDCSINMIVPFNSNSGKGYGSLYITTGTNNQTSQIEWFDSTLQKVDYQAEFTYIKDTIRINKKEFFLVDGSGRIIEFNTLENPLDMSSESYQYTYNYDAQGFLIGKKWYLPSYSTDIPFFTYQYDWVNGNLTAIEVREATGDKRLALKAELRYDETREAKNFLYFLPESNELAPYILSVNLGEKSKNIPQLIKIDLYDSDGTAIKTYTTEFKDYQFTPDGYVSGVFASGDIMDGLPLVNGLTKFEYDCQ